MAIPDSIIRDFVTMEKEPVKNNGDTTLFGTVVSVTGRDAVVRLDGSEMDTPASLSMDAERNDRVSVLIKNHEAIVNGNITSPASARTATKYMRFTDDGLKIGSFGSEDAPSGTYVLITDNAYYIKAADDTILLSISTDGTRITGVGGKLAATFLSDGVHLYDNSETLTAEFFASGPRLYGKSDGVRIYDAPGENKKLLARFKSDGIRFYRLDGTSSAFFIDTGAYIYNHNGKKALVADSTGVHLYDNSETLTAEFFASGPALYGKSDGVRIYDAPGDNKKLLALFKPTGIIFYDANGVVKESIRSDGVRIYRNDSTHAASFIDTGAHIYNENGKRAFLADATGVHLYDNSETLTAEFFASGPALYGKSDGVRIYDAPGENKKLLARFKSDGIRFYRNNGTHAASFVDTGAHIYNENGKRTLVADATGVHLYDNSETLTAEFFASGPALYGKSDGVRIYDAPGENKKILATFKADGLRLYGTVGSGTSTTSRKLAEFATDGIKLMRPNGKLSVKIDDSDMKLYDSRGEDDDAPISLREEIGAITNNYNKLVMALVNHMASNIVTSTERITLPALPNALTLYKAEPTIPAGYTLTGIRDIIIQDQNGDVSYEYSLNQFGTSDTTVHAWIYSSSSTSAVLTVRIEWFAVRSVFQIY